MYAKTGLKKSGTSFETHVYFDLDIYNTISLICHAHAGMVSCNVYIYISSFKDVYIYSIICFSDMLMTPKNGWTANLGLNQFPAEKMIPMKKSLKMKQSFVIDKHQSGPCCMFFFLCTARLFVPEEFACDQPLLGNTEA